jgi:hypothetical protein
MTASLWQVVPSFVVAFEEMVMKIKEMKALDFSLMWIFVFWMEGGVW